MASNGPNARTLLLVLILVIGVVAAIFLLVQPDRRSPGEKLGDALDEVSDGLGDAGRALGDQSPGERLKDRVEDAGENLRDSTR